MDVFRGTRGEVVVRLRGRFDEDAVTRLAGWLEEPREGGAVVLDFAEVRGLDDFCLGRIAPGLAEHNVVVRGLGQHHVRMLRYLGFGRRPSPDEVASRAYEDEE